MENPKKLYNHPDWPPSISVEKENVNQDSWDMGGESSAKRETREKYEEGCNE